MTTPADFTFIHRLRVRWAEVDGQHVVFNGHYLTYLDVAITEFWRHAGLPFPAALAFHQGDMFVRRNLIEYHAPARMDDWLDIGLRCDRIGHSSITVAWAIWTQGRLLVTGEVVNVYVDVHTRVPQAVPQGMRDQLDAFARGEALYRVEVGDWVDPTGESRDVAVRLHPDDRVDASNIERLPVAVGGSNLLDNYPDLSSADINYFGNFPYDFLSPIGMNGAYYYARLDFTF